MKAIEIQGSFGLENLKQVERDEPAVKPGQVKLRMKAVSLNYRDLLMVQGLYDPRQPLPLIPCSDGVGEVVEVGEGVSRVAVGDRVCPIFAQKWISGEPTHEKLRSTLGGPYDGTLTESMVLSEEGLVKVPDHLSDAEAATLPCAAVTAWSALVTLGQVKAGDTVLVQGTGGVSIFALQFAKLLGARVLVTSSSDEKLERVQAMGADEVINYRTEPKWGKVARERTGRVGVDHIIEVGGAGTLQQSLRAIRIGGHISLIGVLSGGVSDVNILPLVMGQVKVQGLVVGAREGFEAMNRAIDTNQMKPVVDKVFSFDQAQEAFQHLEAGKHFGKVCIEIPSKA
ncbi:MAG: NAD(P)-dependent alcohol dehydrogenase [Deltaproteobacteria bacterium]|nr:MAG: NAD(P)-dependent alcohol dehydrogenase [Deltaproteobacteria bacterium]